MNTRKKLISLLSIIALIIVIITGVAPAAYAGVPVSAGTLTVSGTSPSTTYQEVELVTVKRSSDDILSANLTATLTGSVLSESVTIRVDRYTNGSWERIAILYFPYRTQSATISGSWSLPSGTTAIRLSRFSEASNTYSYTLNYTVGGYAASTQEVDAVRIEAINAKNAANTAATNAQNAYSAAQNTYSAANAAKASADQAAANTTYGGQSAAYWAYLAAQGGADTTPPTIQKVGGQKGATCTTTGTFYVVVQATDNKTGQLQARAQVDGGTWTGWYNILQSAIPVTLSSAGAHTITVEVKDAAGNSSQATMTAFRV
ncbi:MAG: hypothetical protein IMW95_12810 [Moorella humiferrea]|nr:hypothetical protein [Moorella humiferrea]